MHLASIPLLSALVAGLAVACGGAVYTSSPGGTDSGASDGGTRDSGPVPFDANVPDTFEDAPGPWSPVCPTAPPSPGTACSQANLQCEYGSAWWSVACDTVMQCQSGQWAVYKPSFEPCTPQPGPNPASCPPDYASVAQGSMCAANGLSCLYDQGMCACQVPLGGPVFIDGGTGYWGCVPENGCPFPRARLGTACTSEGVFCTYEQCSYAQSCEKGVWQSQLEACAQAGGGAGQ